MSSLVIGASGLVGSHLLGALREKGEAVTGTCHSGPEEGLQRVDLRDREAVFHCVERSRPRTVYLPASLTNVDYCETHEEESFGVNVLGVRHAAASAARVGARVVYFSSDYVFPGDAGPYRESDPVRPLSVYGRHKLLAERSLPGDALVLRTTVVYGWEARGKNFICRLRRALERGEQVPVPADQIGNPTYAPNLARAAVALAQRGARGIYHVAGPERASRYRFAQEAARVFGLNPDLIRPVATAELHQSASRPLEAGMVVEKAQAELPFPLLGYPEGLRALRDQEGVEAG